MELIKIDILLEFLKEYREEREPEDVQIVDHENKAISQAIALIVDVLENDLVFRLNNGSY